VIEAIGNAVLKALVVTALVAGMAYAWPARPTDPDAVRQQSGNTVLYDHRDTCWSGLEPAHVDVPTHVIMRVENGVPPHNDWFYGGKRWVRIALIDVFEHNNPDVYVVAFCE
jgi:hypothetical protein